ncbi:hypothetical protein V5O48_017102 [Marasmius crinis-equi]|uniref:Uncharacterized protein n=1 Tax=Marasmius crinis-equi TaxID=585013 RepID=A0ABR3EPX1_9AGAR
MTSSLHHWSFDPAGQPPLSTATCDLLGLPLQLKLSVYPPTRYSWNNTAYKWIHDYQVARGFDPTTPDFACSLGYPIFQVQRDSHRFKEVADGAFAEPSPFFLQLILSLNFGAATAATSTSSATDTTTSLATPPTEPSSKPVTIHSNPISSTSIWPERTLVASEQSDPPNRTESDSMQTHVDINQIASMAFGSAASVSNNEPFYFSASADSSMSYNPNGPFGDSFGFDTSYETFASGSNAISPHSTSDWSSSFYHSNTLPPSAQHAVPTSFNGQPPHAAGASGAAYTAPVYSYTPDFSFRASSSGYHGASAFPTHNNRWNPSPPSSSIAYGQFLPMPPVSSLPPAAYTLPSFSHSNTSEALRGWNTADTPSLKRKERDRFDFGGMTGGGGTKRARLFGPEQADAISRPWPVQEAEFGVFASELECGVAIGVQGVQLYELSGGMSGPVAQTSRLQDEVERLRQENDMLRGMVGSSGGSGSDSVF